MSPFSELLKDEVFIIKVSGLRLGPFLTALSSNYAPIFNSSLDVDEGDQIERTLPNGKKEIYTITEAIFHQQLGGIPAHYDLKLRKEKGKAVNLTSERKHKGDLDTIPNAKNYVINNNYNNSTTINGNIQGSNVALSNSSISVSNTSYNSAEELAKGFQSLTDLIQELSEAKQKDVENAVRILISTTMPGNVSVSEIKNAVLIVSKASPSLESKLKDIGLKIGTSLVSSTIFQILKTAILGY